VTFVASGSAWALDATGTRATCLFGLPDPGPFEWGPLGDRALVGGLEVKGLSGAPSVPPTSVQASVVAWSRPTGKSIVFAPSDGSKLEKIHLDGEPLEDVSPLSSAHYLDVTYHPSGLAFASIVQAGKRQEIWLSSNTGEHPQKLVFSTVGTEFGPLAFEADGASLLYAAQWANNHPELHFLSLKDRTSPAVWSGPVGQRILSLQPSPASGTFAWTVGSSCDSSSAMVKVGGAEAIPLLPDETAPTRVVGWLDESHVVVATGGCDAPLDLSSVDISSATVAPLVFGVDEAAVRTPVPTPPPPLPATEEGVGSAVG